MQEISTPKPAMLNPPDAETLARQFAKIKPPLTDSEAVIEATRCLFCHDAPCTIACPSDIDIPMFIRQISSKNAKGAAKTIFTQNIMGKACAVVCPTQVLCEGSCVYHGLNEKPIDIGRLQAYATDYAIERNIRFFEKGQPTGKKIAVIGSGPAGLSCAHELTRLGHSVVVFEASAKAGGLNMYGVAPYKFNNEDAKREIAYVSEIGFEIRTKTPVSAEKTGVPSVTLSELEKEFDSIFLAVGLGKSHRPGIPGEHLSGVEGAAEFIYRLRELDQHLPVGRQVAVIGAGNTAIDAAVETAKLGAEVTLIYRRREQDQSAYDFEVEHAKQAGVKFLYLTAPLEILGSQHVEGLRCVRNEVLNTSTSDKGKVDIQPIAGSEFVLPCDMVIFATGQEKMVDFYSQISGLDLDRGKVVVNEKFQTTNPKYFAGGDCVNGGKEVVNAVAHGRDAARGIHEFLNAQTANAQNANGGQA
jgi:dihydropyrimidine dehydrogenase (NAD+) subunit PreT